jgi:Trk K+ transport system NAD-binding subunit
LRIVSRITYARNREAIHRAGADLVLSYAPLGAESVMSIILERESVILGEGVDFFRIKLPASLHGKTLGEAKIGNLTGLIVIGVETGGKTEINLTSNYRLTKNANLNILGTAEQIKKFEEIFGV